ncbi:MAG: CmcJ/NvfI family oxidoreductase [Myxococcota bacterium]
MPSRGRVQYHEAGSGCAQILIDSGGVSGNRIDPPYRAVEIALEDARIDPPTWSRDRLQFSSAPSVCLETGAFDRVRDDYEAELITLLRRQLAASEIVIFDHTHRSEVEGARPPSYHVHCDYNAWSARTRLSTLLGEDEARRWAQGPFGVVNVWRPREGPVQRAPIGFVRPHSVDAADWLDVDIVFPDRRGQIRGLRHDPAHRWLAMPQMRTDQVAIFATYHSEGIDGVPHAAVELLDGPDAPPRRSIESRAFVRWA